MSQGKFVKLTHRLLGVAIVLFGVFLCVVAVQFWGAPHILVAAESLYWMDTHLWVLVLSCLAVMCALLWLAASFSFLALASVVCVAIALYIVISGLSFFWALILLLLALWGVSRASQEDSL
ncbi:hypothetical protein [Shewanella gelidii]|uniref:Uncharacterized protein n=1 Tax=Shewanella gelidii TaxID=1642821 RepID=A0A917JQY7_9GAMM|nr:hypothetical protein [Shewanella gelidii]MCL1097718.1 hypothetical protein [Shewanella gelidii]GGI79315.1 hypothetical protein GCM10009332_15880 [Shewanella gelidii]